VAIDWSNEPFARLYKRETDDDLLLSWEARAVWHEFLKKCDRSGMLETRRGVPGLAALLRVPLDVIENALQQLIEDGRLRSVPNVGFVAPNYLQANDAPRSDRVRQAESRLRRKQDALSGGNPKSETLADCHTASRDVTCGHTASQPVTHIRAEHIKSDHLNAPLGQAEPAVPAPREKRKSRLPDEWQPRSEERHLARELGVDCDAELASFGDHYKSKGEARLDWDASFRNWLRNAVRFGRKPGQRSLAGMSGGGPRRIKDL
jgi:hypothetical protein